ncbi:MAG: hypothetical protein WC180_02755 [Candidatus Paceibacterota bacterium]
MTLWEVSFAGWLISQKVLTMKREKISAGNLLLILILCTSGATLLTSAASASSYTVSYIDHPVLGGEDYTLQAKETIFSGEKEYRSTQDLEIWFKNGYSGNELPQNFEDEMIQYCLFTKLDHILARYDEGGLVKRFAEEGDRQHIKLSYRALEGEPVIPFLCADGFSVRYVDDVDFMLTNPYDDSLKGRRQMMSRVLDFYCRCSGFESDRSVGDLDTVLLLHPRAFDEHRKAAKLDVETMNSGYIKFELV